MACLQPFLIAPHRRRHNYHVVGVLFSIRVVLETVDVLVRLLPQLLEMIVAKLGIEGEGVLAETDVVVARKSFDARTKKARRLETDFSICFVHSGNACK